jgi:WD40 repeat protein/DNA-binding SARP family transcriptional activator
MFGGTVGEVSGLEFRVLGPLEAWRGGEQLRVGGERQRGLLALLLVHANELVRTEQLVDQLFGGEQSDGGVNAVRVAVSRLRRLLDGGQGNGVLVTRPGGYVLHARPEQLDVARFEQLLADGKRALSGGEPLAAASALREALSLWRGPALADLSLLEFVQPEIRRLEELRLLAVTERIDADLALGRDAELIPEIEALVASNPMQERLRGQLMLALYRAGRQADALTVYRESSEFLRDELGLEPSRALQDLERSILRQDEALDVERIQAPVEDEVAVCPFKGLAFFDRSDAEYFCGRERLVAELVSRCTGATLVGIVGASGMGKSSVLRAGLLPALAGGVLPGSAGWRQYLLRPGERPREELAAVIAADGIRAALARLAPGDRCVLAVDQLEELFTVCHDEDERAAFIDELMQAAKDHDRRALVLVSLRADFYGRCASYPSFAELLSGCHVLVGPMEPGELARAIELPASRAGLHVERGLVEALVAEVAGEPGGLPHLSSTLLELWGLRDGRSLRLAVYRASGGVRGAVARVAEEAYTRLGEADRAVARNLMLRLATGDEGSLVRRRLPRSELARLDGAERVLAVLTDARLLTASDGEVEVSHEALLREWPRFRGWLEEDRVGRRLHAHLAASVREWEARGQDTGDLYRGARLAAALDWAAQREGELNRSEREFLDASRAEAERETRGQRRLNRRLRGLLFGALALLVAAIAAGVVALAKQATASSEARVALARQLGEEAVNEPRIDRAMLLAREAINIDRDPETESTLLATLLRSPQAVGTFTAPIDSRPQSVTVSPDGRTLAVPDNIGNLRFYDPVTRALQRSRMVGTTPEPVEYSNDGSLLVDVPSAPAIEVRNAHTLALVKTLKIVDPAFLAAPTLDNFYNSHLISPDHRIVYYAYWVLDPTTGSAKAAYLDRWSLPTGRRLPTVPLGNGPISMGLIDREARLAVINRNGLRVFDARTLRPLQDVPFRLPPATLFGAISPDARTAAFGSMTGSVYFVNLRTGHITPSIGGHSAEVTDVVYSPDGRTVVTTGDDNQVKVWDPTTATTTAVLTGHAGEVHGAAFSPDGRTLYTASLDGVLFEWDLGGDRRFGLPVKIGPPLACCAIDNPGTVPLAVASDGSRFATRIGASAIGLFFTRTGQEQTRFHIGAGAGVPTAIAWSPAGSQLAVAGHNGAVQLWDVAGAPMLRRSLEGLRPPAGQSEAVQAVAFSPNGRLLAASDINHTAGPAPPGGRVAIWRTSDGALLGPPRALGSPGDSAAFSRDGKQLAVGLDAGPVQLLNPSNARLLRTLRPIGSGEQLGTIALAFAPQGTLATGSWSGVVQLWNSATGRQLGHPLLAAAAPVGSIAFDPSGRRFATTGGADGTVKLWFTTSLQQEGTSLSQTTGGWGNARFTPDGSKLIAVHDNGQGTIWPATPAAWEQHACAVAGRNLTREEWSRFVTGHSYSRVCP